MFRIGEFSRIAQVSIRMLRHYDEIRLLEPAFVDPVNGYRHYRVEQLGEVNRIVALQDLGLTLEQVGRLMRDEVTSDEIAGMLRLERVRAAEERLRLEERLASLDRRLRKLSSTGVLSDVDLVVKPVPNMPLLSGRQRVADMGAAGQLIEAVAAAGAGAGLDPTLVAIAHGEFFDDRDIDIEVGLPIRRPAKLVTATGLELLQRRLPQVDRMLTAMYVGDDELDGHRVAHAAIGDWLVSHDARLAGPGREVFHGGPQSGTVEIQYPVVSRVGRNRSSDTED